MAVDVAEGIGPIERGDGAVLLEPKPGREHHNLHSARDRHALLISGRGVAQQLLIILAAAGVTKNQSHCIREGDWSCLRAKSREVGGCAQDPR